MRANSYPGLYTRDRRTLLLRLAGALLLSLIVHLLLVYGVPGDLPEHKRVVAEGRVLTVRLMKPRAVPIEVLRPEPVLAGAPPALAIDPPVKSRKASSKPVAKTMVGSGAAAQRNIALPLPFDPVFYTWREVDTAARSQGGDSVACPEEAIGQAGRVSLEVSMNEAGQVTGAQVIDAEPPGYCVDAALTHYRRLSFLPAMKDGRPRRYRARFVVEADARASP